MLKRQAIMPLEECDIMQVSLKGILQAILEANPPRQCAAVAMMYSASSNDEENNVIAEAGTACKCLGRIVEHSIPFLDPLNRQPVTRVEFYESTGNPVFTC